MFVQQGEALPYVVHCVPNATGPITGAPPERPGTIVVATSPDQKQAWFTATVLPHDVGRRAAWLHRDGQPLVIAQQLKPNPNP
jgi:predicted cobalt transporter CbtA